MTTTRIAASLPARAGEVIEIELSCAVHVSGARAPWTGGVMSLTQRCRERMRRLGVSGSRCNELERLGQKFGNEALYSVWKSRKTVVFSKAVLTFSAFLAH